jgi:predicted nucleotidyltransferase
MEKAEVIKKLKELKPLLQNEFSITEIGLFGSFNNDTYTAESDIDLLVELGKPIGWNFMSLEIFLEKAFGRKIDLVTKAALKKQMKDQILKSVTYID